MTRELSGSSPLPRARLALPCVREPAAARALCTSPPHLTAHLNALAGADCRAASRRQQRRPSLARAAAVCDRLALRAPGGDSLVALLTAWSLQPGLQDGGGDRLAQRGWRLGQGRHGMQCEAERADSNEPEVRLPLLPSLLRLCTRWHRRRAADHTPVLLAAWPS